MNCSLILSVVGFFFCFGVNCLFLNRFLEEPKNKLNKFCFNCYTLCLIYFKIVLFKNETVVIKSCFVVFMRKIKEFSLPLKNISCFCP